MSLAEELAAVHSGAGLFSHMDRGLIRVAGRDRVRWLDGMVSNDVAGLREGPERSGCYALLLTRQGRIVADLHVLLRPEAFWLETAAAAVGPVLRALDRLIVADDVTLTDVGRALARIGLEGPSAPQVLAAAVGREIPLSPDACTEVALGGVPVVVAAYGLCGKPGRQLFAPPDARAAVERELGAVGAELGLTTAGPEALEILRIERGVPAWGAELGEDVLPAEARLERAVSTTKGCYTGQEVVERMRSRDQVGHLLVGLRAEGEPLEVGTELCAAGRKVGEVTSACRSPAAGPIGLGFVRRAHAAAGTSLASRAGAVRVVELPFVSGAAVPDGRSP